MSATYRNVAAADELPTTLNGCATLYELFNKAVEEHGDNKCLGWRPVAADGTPGDYEFINYKETQSVYASACTFIAAPRPESTTLFPLPLSCKPSEQHLRCQPRILPCLFVLSLTPLLRPTAAQPAPRTWPLRWSAPA